MQDSLDCDKTINCPCLVCLGELIKNQIPQCNNIPQTHLNGWEDTKHKKRKNSHLDNDLKRMYKKIKFVQGYCRRQNLKINELQTKPPRYDFAIQLQQSLYSDLIKVKQYISQDPVFESKAENKKLQEIKDILMELENDKKN